MEEQSWQEELNAKRLKTKGWYGCIAPDGWKDIVLKADEMLAFIDPDYEIHQIKEKFGTLRYYFGTTKKYETIESNIMYAIERWAEAASANTCEQCGKHGELRTETYYIVTLCDDCNEKRLEEMKSKGWTPREEKDEDDE
jgi:DNA-directed RNA polymerase subunit RPC12/RpoP